MDSECDEARHGFAGGPASHGSMFHAVVVLMVSANGRARDQGQKMPGHMGDTKCTVQNLQIVRVDAEKEPHSDQRSVFLAHVEVFLLSAQRLAKSL